MQDTPATPVLRAMGQRAVWNSRVTSVLPAMNRKPIWTTHPTLVRLAMDIRVIWQSLSCPVLPLLGMRARRRIPRTPFLVIDLPRLSNLPTTSMVKHGSAMPHLPDETAQNPRSRRYGDE